MGRLLLKNDNGQFLKSIDTVNQKAIFTKDKYDARSYDGEWFAETELEFVKFHFKKQEQVESLHMVYE